MEKLNPMIFPRVLVLLSSGIMMPVTGPAPIAKENIYLKLYKGKMNNPFTGNIKYWKLSQNIFMVLSMIMLTMKEREMMVTRSFQHTL